MKMEKMSDTPRERFDKWWSNMAPKDDCIMPAGHAWNGFVEGYQWMRSQLERELAAERERCAKLLLMLGYDEDWMRQYLPPR